MTNPLRSWFTWARFSWTTWATMVSVALAWFILMFVPGNEEKSKEDNQREQLIALEADISQTSVSGISSGAYMAGQFQLAHGSFVKGAAVIAGGPYGCAESVFTGLMPSPGTVFLNASRAVSGCMLNTLEIWGIPDPVALADKARKRAQAGDIDPVSSVVTDRIYLFSGSRDTTVVPAVVDAANKFYRQLGVDSADIQLVKNLPAGHAFITMDQGTACDASKSPFIADCDYDQARELLTHIYGPLAAPSLPLDGTFLEFDQNPFTDGLSRHGMSETGIVFVPRQCRETNGSGCRIHVAFHGCSQSRSMVGDAFTRKSGFARWAANNNIIVLFPQVSISGLNPQSCWDWWGYTGSDYLTRRAPQIVAVRRMLARLTGEMAADEPAPATN